MYLLTKNFKDIFNLDLNYLFSILLKGGDEARLVGGCVRNYILNVEIKDYDIATIYTPDEIENILKFNSINYFSIGKEFGTITAVINGKNYEITTLRKDIKTDGRHSFVEFTKSYKEDAKRRDFTFNSLYIDFNGNLYDYFGGLEDLLNSNIKFIGNSYDRIEEDNLRILRFFRFYGFYCFNFNHYDLYNCIKYKNKIKNLSIERVSSEFYNILNSKYPVSTLKFMQYHGILYEIFNCESINFYNLEIFYSIKDYINFKYNHVFIVSLILSINDINYNLMLTKKEAKYLSTIINNVPDKLSYFEVKRLLFILKDRFLVKSIIILYFCNNYTSFKNIVKFCKFIDKFKIPEFKITGDDLSCNDFNNRTYYSKIINRADELFINSNFKYSKKKIIKLLKKEFLSSKKSFLFRILSKIYKKS